MKVLAIIGVVVARSTEWELGVRWHIMIPPYDWAEMYLRHRYDEATPGLAIKIDSLTGDQPAPYVTDPDDVPWR